MGRCGQEPARPLAGPCFRLLSGHLRRALVRAVWTVPQRPPSGTVLASLAPAGRPGRTGAPWASGPQRRHRAGWGLSVVLKPSLGRADRAPWWRAEARAPGRGPSGTPRWSAGMASRPPTPSSTVCHSHAEPVTGPHTRSPARDSVAAGDSPRPGLQSRNQVPPKPQSRKDRKGLRRTRRLGSGRGWLLLPTPSRPVPPVSRAPANRCERLSGAIAPHKGCRLVHPRWRPPHPASQKPPHTADPESAWPRRRDGGWSEQQLHPRSSFGRPRPHPPPPPARPPTASPICSARALRASSSGARALLGSVLLFSCPAVRR